MLFERFEVKGLSHYSYAIGCTEAGKIAIIDPQRDIDIYTDFAKQQGVTISHVLETHIHADFASGARSLAEKTGAVLWLSAYDEDEIFEVSFSRQRVYDGDRLQIGTITIQALHTPGHTPEHLSFLVFDEKVSSIDPLMMFSGDFLFVGSLGRPDLLGEDAKHQLAEKLFISVQEKLKNLPDSLKIYPAHGAGSMCGAGMSGAADSTLGKERKQNPYLETSLEKGAFIDKILSTVPPFPDYFKRMKRVNSEGANDFHIEEHLKSVNPKVFKDLLDKGSIVIDLRDQHSYAEGHIPNAFGIGLGPSLATWASWVVPYDTPILLVGEEGCDYENAVRQLGRVNLDLVEGYLEGGMNAWVKAGFPLKTIEESTPEELHERITKDGNIKILDVRSRKEFAQGHIEEALNIPGGELSHSHKELQGHKGGIAVLCEAGYRSTIAVSILERAGYDQLINITGGMRAWREAELSYCTA